MGEKNEEFFLGNNSIEDVSWLCSLSESELDFLISLKKLALKRARVIGHVQLANKFDLKMLRALGFILMKYFKGKAKDSLLLPGVAEPAAFVDSSNLLKLNLDDVMSIEELKECIALNTRKEFCKRPRDKDAVIRSSKRHRSSQDPEEETESWQQKIKVEETTLTSDDEIDD